MKDYFKVAGDLGNRFEKENTNNYFKVAGNLKSENNDYTIKSNMVDEINQYLSNIVSGKTYGFESEFGTVCSAGNVIVSFNELQQMVEDGSYNIIKATCLNKDVIQIEYQQFNKDVSKKNM